VEIKNIYIGKPDAKDEINYDGYDNFLETYVVPPNVNLEDLIKRKDRFFIRGYKGTGKTALLFYLNNEILCADQQACTSFIFFKEDYTPIKRKQMGSVANSISYSIDLSKDTLLKEDDFEYIWRWIIFKKIVEDNDAFNGGLFVANDAWNSFKDCIRRIGSDGSTRKIFKLPQKVALGVEKASVEVDFGKDGISSSNLFVKIIDKAQKCFRRLKRTDIPYYIFVDELEAFYSDVDVFKRDLRLIRDLIITVKDMNTMFSSLGFKSTKMILSIRTEIINSINRFVIPKEINKITSGFEIVLNWNYNTTSTYKHPIVNIWLKRIQIAEAQIGNHMSLEAIYKKWFPESINGTEPAVYILNNSWLKPRDIVRYLLCIQNSMELNRESYSQQVFDAIRGSYSKECLKEIVEELNALYSPKDIEMIISCFRGFKIYFSYAELCSRVKELSDKSTVQENLYQIVQDLYRVGFLGNRAKYANDFHWLHRGNDICLTEDGWIFCIHQALTKELFLTVRNSKITSTGVPNLGDCVEICVKKILRRGLICSFEKRNTTYNGFVSINEISSDFIADINDVLEVGEKYRAFVIGFDVERNTWHLSIKIAAELL